MLEMPNKRLISTKNAMGFQSLAYAGLETGLRDRTSYVVLQDKI
jgi:4-hydroxyphenylpyruvate dioxygenase